MENTHYTWRTVQDSKVRSSHADRDGKVFSWTDPPEGGHPGEDFGCRCWAEEDKCVKLAVEAIEALQVLTRATDKEIGISRRIGKINVNIPKLEDEIKGIKYALYAANGGSLAGRLPIPYANLVGAASQFGAVALEFKLDELESQLSADRAEVKKLKIELENLNAKSARLKKAHEQAKARFQQCRNKYE